MKTTLRTSFAAALTCAAILAAGIAPAQDIKAGDLTIEHPWARPNLPSRPLGVYFGIVNSGSDADRLIAATAPGFEAVELHTVVKDGDVMKMQPLEALDVPASGRADLMPGGNHLMLFGASELYEDGGRFPVTLQFEKAGEVAIEVAVQKRPPEGAPAGMDHGAGHGAGHDTMQGHGHGAPKPTN
ncbi:copper chaperone PCu(A)C [Limibaculum sp. FT325]|uniref:copper chaperone PCu(A)C n=1 Tax=Thermohalobaculum sediminis TaxID=2939436 RepID=UPI0020BE3C48|nr:copper chaperone PCu(A)C [Limibaculum sediminis]MCL5778943.1 copper chaperone PCu(A)C [Limibaculum sediminis]